MGRALTLVVFAGLTIPLFAQRTAKLAGFSDAAVYDGDKIVRLTITAAIEVQLPGVYRLTFDMTAANGNALTGQARSRLEAGVQSLAVSFEAKQIDARLAQDGPYRIAGARLLLERADAEPADADSISEGGMTAKYALADLQRDLYSFTGEIEAEGADPTPDGKFRALRVHAGVITPGGGCSVGGTLSSQAMQIATEIELANGDRVQQVPPGKGTVTIDFQGAKIAKSGVDGPLVVSGLKLQCSGKYINDRPFAEDPQKHRTARFRASDFDNPDPDFEFVMPPPVRVAAGDPIPAYPKIREIGALEGPIQLTARADEPLQVHMFDKWMGNGSASRWKQGDGISFALTAPADIPAGEYRVQLVGRGNGKEHTAELTVIIDADLSRRRQQRVDALAALTVEDAELPSLPDSAPVSGPVVNASRPAIKFYADAELRKIHAVLVLDRSSSMFSPFCGFLKASATRFSRLFVADRDSVGVISYGLNVETTLPLTDGFWTDAPDRIAKLQCFGATNTGEALEAAQKELAEHEDPEAINAVILFTDGVPNVLTADWPVKMPLSGCRGQLGYASFCNKPPRICEEDSGGTVTGTLMPTYGEGGFEPPGLSEADELSRDYSKNRSANSCFGSDAIENLAFIPEQDWQGVSVIGSYPLERYKAGPYAGKIRIDLHETILNAVANQVENAAQRLRTGSPSPTFVYVIGFANPAASDAVKSLASLQKLANDPGGPFFDPKQPEGLAILTDDPEGFWPAFQQVRQDIVQHATIHEK